MLKIVIFKLSKTSLLQYFLFRKDEIVKEFDAIQQSRKLREQLEEKRKKVIKTGMSFPSDCKKFVDSFETGSYSR